MKTNVMGFSLDTTCRITESNRATNFSKTKPAFITFTVCLFFFLFLASLSSDALGQGWKKRKVPAPSSRAVVEYMAHLQGTGDTEWVTQPDMCGTTGQNRRLEGFAIRASDAGEEEIGLRYKVYLQDLGEQGWTYMPNFAGTRYEKRRLEAFWIEVVEKPDQYSVYYRAHLAGSGWTGWYKNGEMCGTKNRKKAVEAIEIMMVDKSEEQEKK